MKRARPRIIEPDRIRCVCGHVIYDGDVIRSRVLKVSPEKCEAKCRCKRWHKVPLQLTTDRQ